ncbi:hypothetical protein INR49_018895 [Caranx melampygus]|nr:hypothetical protein INR49_018895 [Caranx melampygus]
MFSRRVSRVWMTPPGAASSAESSPQKDDQQGQLLLQILHLPHQRGVESGENVDLDALMAISAPSNRSSAPSTRNLTAPVAAAWLAWV